MVLGVVAELPMSKEITFRLLDRNCDGYRNLTVPEDVTWDEFADQVRRTFGSDEMKIKYVDSDEDEVCLDTAEELEEAIRWNSKKQDSEDEQQSGRDGEASSDVAWSKDEIEAAAPRRDGVCRLDKEWHAVPAEHRALLASASEGHAGATAAAAGAASPAASTAPSWFREAIEQLKAELLGKLGAESDRPTLALRHWPPNHVVHAGVCCDYCSLVIVGVRYKCGSCPDYDLCEACEVLAEEIHPLDHAFIKLRRSTTTAGRTNAGRLVPLLIGSPYDELPDKCSAPAEGWSKVDEAAAAATEASFSSSRTCRTNVAGMECRLRKLEKVESRMVRNRQLQEELRHEEMRLQERIDRGAAASAAAGAASVSSPLHCPGGGFADGSRRDCAGAAAATGWATRCSGDESAPDRTRLGRKLEKVQRQIGKMAKQHEKLHEKQSCLVRCLSRDYSMEGVAAATEAAAAADPGVRKAAKKCSRSQKKASVPRIAPHHPGNALAVRPGTSCCLSAERPLSDSLVYAAAAARVAAACQPAAGRSCNVLFWCTGFRATFVGDETVPDGSKLAGGTKFVKRWMLRNDGATGWDQHVTLKMLWGNIPSSVSETALPLLAPGEQGVVSVEFEAPREEGHYRSSWRPCHGGKKFGNEFWCSIKVIPRTAFGESASARRCADGSTDRRVDSGEVELEDLPEDLLEDLPAAEAAEPCAVLLCGASPDANGMQGGTAATSCNQKLGAACSAKPPAFEQGHSEVDGQCRAAEASAAAASLETVCHYVHMKMTATSQTATPNNTPMAMSPPKSPEPSAVIRGCGVASSLPASGHCPSSGDGKGSSVVRSLGRDWDLAAAERSAGKSDLVNYSCKSDSEEDGCYDDDDFCVVPVPACFNLEVPFLDATLEPAAAAAAAGGDACQPAKPGAADGTAAAVAAFTGSPERRSALDNRGADHFGGNSAFYLGDDDANQGLVSSVCAAPSSAEPRSLAVPDSSVMPNPTVIGGALSEQPAAADPSTTKTPCVYNLDLATTPDADGAVASGAVIVSKTPSTSEGNVAVTPCALVPRPESFDSDGKEVEQELVRGAIENEARHASSSLTTESHQKRPLGIAEYVYSRVRGAVQDLWKMTDEDDVPAPPVSNITYELHSVDREDGSPSTTDATLSPDVPIVENFRFLSPAPMSAVDQLVAMGFANRPLNMELLQKHNGDIDAVLHELLDEHGNEWYSRRH